MPPVRLYRRLPNALVGATLAVFFASLQLGGDGTNYAKWTEAAITHNTDALRSLGTPELTSPTGIPFHQWSAAPGLFAAPIALLTTDYEFAFLTASSMSAILFLVVVFHQHA